MPDIDKDKDQTSPIIKKNELIIPKVQAVSKSTEIKRETEPLESKPTSSNKEQRKNDMNFLIRKII
jgi:hypothetical protein